MTEINSDDKQLGLSWAAVPGILAGSEVEQLFLEPASI